MDDINKKVFDSLSIYFTKFSDIKFENGHFSIKNRGQCVDFSVSFVDSLNSYVFLIWNLRKSKFSGYDTLERLEFLAKNVDVKYLILDDMSSKNFVYDIDLASILILSTGQSWYNSIGFFSENHKREQETISFIRNLTFVQLHDKLKQLSYHEWLDRYNKSSDEFDDGLSLFSDFMGEEVTPENFSEFIQAAIEYVTEMCKDLINLKISVASAYIYLGLKDKVLNSEDVILPHYVYIALISYLLPYDRENLIKKIP